jgi:hypothetical protein
LLIFVLVKIPWILRGVNPYLWGFIDEKKEGEWLDG